MSDIAGKFRMPKSEMEKELARELERGKILLQEIELPFLYGWKWYKWAKEFFDSTNKINLLCAANQISKSSTQIRRCIDHATNKELWPKLWERQPTQFWYLYPTRDQTDIEFETKWKLFLPKGEMKDDEYYGWKLEKKSGHVMAIHFNSGVHVYFKTYNQDSQALQSGTCDEIFCDEELPVEHFDELCFRLTATNGYFNMVFTATLGQEYWRLAMEPGETEVEVLPQAFKQTVSLYEAQEYLDGTPSHWTLDRIKAVEARCSTTLEVLKRVFGRFVVVGGRKYESFDIKRHFKPKPSFMVPKGWLIYAGADVGGGGDGHPSALCYVAVKPDFKAGRVFLGWRGDDVVTTSGDVVNKHIEFTKEFKLAYTGKHYDWGNKDFETIAQRMGHPFEKADKSHERGEDVINTLFKNDMLYIYEDFELRKLGAELAVLKKDTPKRTAKDDFADALRYCVTKIPWDFTAIMAKVTDEEPEETLTDMQRQVRERRKAMSDETESENDKIEAEFDEWNEAYEGF